MQIIEVGEPLVDSKEWSHEVHERTAGCHVSNIIYDLEKDMKGDDSDKFADFGEQKLEMYRMVGFLFERAMYDVFMKDDDITRPGEVKKDGIILTPDALRISDHRLLETKATWRGMGDGLHDIMGIKFWTWWEQIKAYCHVLGCEEAELWALFMNGDYRTNRGPTLRKIVVGFKKQELAKSWDMLVRRARRKKWL